MNHAFIEIERELLLSKTELEARLYEASFHGWLATGVHLDEKERLLLYHLQADLSDVNLALEKLANGTYGICEETGQVIPIENLKVLPTARTIHDFYYQHYFEKDMIYM